jgi:Zn-dependent M32 family carboxypeptidase
MFASQIKYAMNKSINTEELISRKDFKPIISWLNEKISTLDDCGRGRVGLIH